MVFLRIYEYAAYFWHKLLKSYNFPYVSTSLFFDQKFTKAKNVVENCSFWPPTLPSYASCEVRCVNVKSYSNAGGSEELAARLSCINECIDELKAWMGCNMLKLNSEKTEFIIFASKKSPGRNITPSLPWNLRDTNIFSRTVSGCNFRQSIVVF